MAFRHLLVFAVSFGVVRGCCGARARLDPKNTEPDCCFLVLGSFFLRAGDQDGVSDVHETQALACNHVGPHIPCILGLKPP